MSANFTLEQLREHAPKLDISLPDWKACKCIKNALTRRTENRCVFKMLYCAKTGDKWDIYIYAHEIGLKSNDNKEIVSTYSWLSLFCVELAKVDIALELIDTYVKDSDVTTASNKI